MTVTPIKPLRSVSPARTDRAPIELAEAWARYLWSLGSGKDEGEWEKLVDTVKAELRQRVKNSSVADHQLEDAATDLLAGGEKNSVAKILSQIAQRVKDFNTWELGQRQPAQALHTYRGGEGPRHRPRR